MNLSTFLRDLQVTAGIPRGLARILGAPPPWLWGRGASLVSGSDGDRKVQSGL